MSILETASETTKLENKLKEFLEISKLIIDFLNTLNLYYTSCNYN